MSAARELAVGAASTDERAHYGRLQAKTVFKPLDAGGWGIGWCWPTSSARTRLDGDLSANVPLSFSLRTTACCCT
jgi:hypothetical protein